MSRCLQCGGVYGTCVCEPIPHQFTYVQLLLYTKSEIEAEVAAERARCVALVKPYEWILTDRGSEEQDQFRAMLAAIESGEVA